MPFCQAVDVEHRVSLKVDEIGMPSVLVYHFIAQKLRRSSSCSFLRAVMNN